MDRSKMLRSFTAVVLTAVLALTLAACSFNVSVGSVSPSPTAPPSAPSAPNTLTYDEGTVIKNAKAVIDLVNAGNYLKLYGMLRDDVQKQATADSLKAMFDKGLSAAGKMQKYGDAKTSVSSDKQYGTYVAVQVQVQYESAELIYTVSFDKDMKLIGLYANPAEAQKLDYDEKTVVKNAKTVIDAINSGDYKSIYAMLRDDVKKTTTPDGLKTSFSQIVAPAGKFVSYKNAATDVKSSSDYGTYIAVQVAAQHASAELTYVVDFDKDMKLVGLSVK